jgi:hypothetical protein
MKRPLLAAVLGLALAGPAAAECYGVSQVSDANCSPDAAAGELAPRLAGDGWTLLNVLSTFGPEGLEERKASAGEFFLRY